VSLGAPEPHARLRTLAFAAPAGGAWGAALFPAGDAGALIVGDAAGAAVLAARLTPGGEADGWRIESDGAALLVTAQGELAEVAEFAGFEQRVVVCGQATVGGRHFEIVAPGCHGQRTPAVELPATESIRVVSAWFGEQGAMGLVSLRPRKARGHEGDTVSAALLGEEAEPPISGPRLSSTYSATGQPVKVNIELWYEDPERHPRRVAGEATGSGAQGRSGGWELRAELLQCHTRGEEGTGVYLLGRRG